MDEDTLDYTGLEIDPQAEAYKEYLAWCKLNKTHPRVSDFWVWLDDYDVVI